MTHYSPPPSELLDLALRMERISPPERLLYSGFLNWSVRADGRAGLDIAGRPRWWKWAPDDAPIQHASKDEDPNYVSVPCGTFLFSEYRDLQLHLFWQAKVRTRRGVRYLDFALVGDAGTFAIETDGKSFHNERRDHARDQELNDVGVLVKRFTGSEVTLGKSTDEASLEALQWAARVHTRRVREVLSTGLSPRGLATEDAAGRAVADMVCSGVLGNLAELPGRAWPSKEAKPPAAPVLRLIPISDTNGYAEHGDAE